MMMLLSVCNVRVCAYVCMDITTSRRSACLLLSPTISRSRPLDLSRPIYLYVVVASSRSRATPPYC